MLVHFTRVSRLENGLTAPTRQEVTAAERLLQAGGKLIDAYQRQLGLPRPRELPPAPGILVGRDRHLVDLDTGLTEHGPDAPLLIVIDGPAGAGKTALALRWAHRNATRFPDGQLYADLKGFSNRDAEDPAKILEEFCRTLGAAEVPASLEARAALFRSLTSSTRMLIVLDNAAGVDQVKPLLPGSADCAVVVTSRRTLSALTVAHDAQRVSVGALAARDATTLLSELIGKARVDKDPVAVSDLGRLCGGLPLALRIVAELAVLHPARSLADLCRDLEDERLDTLDGVDEETTPRTVFSWSYRALPREAARVFRLLGLHQGPHLTVPAVAALADITQRDARAAIRHLRALHLLDLTSPYEGVDAVSMHTLVRAYAHDLATAIDSDDERSAARRRLSLWFGHTAHAATCAINPHHAIPADIPELPHGQQPERFDTSDSARAWWNREQPNLQVLSQDAAFSGVSPGAREWPWPGPPE
jgi:hypothetical protein